jgi:hypothetical protein
LLGNDGDLGLALFNIKNRVGGIALIKDDFLISMRDNGTVLGGGCQE